MLLPLPFATSADPRSATMTPSLLRAALVLGLTWVLGAWPAHAQAPDQSAEADTSLYEIAPREIEIRGRLEVDLPSLERQPLRDLAPSVQVPTLPPTRQPYIGTYKRTLAEIPQQLPEPAPPSDALTPSGPASPASITAGGGRYLSRFIRGRMHVPLSSSESLELQGDYEGSEGHTPFDNDDAESAFDRATARLQFESRRSAYQLSAALHGFADSYTLYGVQPAASIPDRVGLSAGATADLETRGSVPVALGLSYEETEYETGDRAFDESRLHAHGTIDVPLAPRALRLDGAFTASGLNGNFAADGDVVAFTGGALLTLFDTETYSLDAGARLLTFDGVVNPTAASAPDASAEFFAPYVKGRWRAAPALELYAHWTPRLDPHGLASTMATNPFVQHGPTLLPTLETTHAEGGARLTVGAVEVRAFAGYRYAPSFRYFLDTAPSTGRFGVFFDSAEILQGGAQVALRGLETVQASARLLIRDGTLTDTDRAIPNFAPVLGEGSVSVSFLDQKAFLELTGTVESPRYVTRDESAEVGTYADVDLNASYAVTPLLEVLARVQNIGSGTLEQWERYPRPPTVISTGLRLHW